MDELLDQPLAWPDVAGQRVLIVGVGGGCDILMAYALSTLPALREPAELCYGTTKSRISTETERIIAHVHRLPSAQDPNAGDAWPVETLVPRGERGCPLIFLAPRDQHDPGPVGEIRALGFDLLIGVDTGGDSLVEGAVSGPEGRDKRMLRALRATGLPLLHIVAAPGSDGESTAEQIRATLLELHRQGCYAGCFDLRPLVPLLKRLAASLAAERTPNMIVRAAAGKPSSRRRHILVRRGLKPWIPHEWLLRGFAFEWGREPAGTAR